MKCLPVLFSIVAEPRGRPKDLQDTSWKTKCNCLSEVFFSILVEPRGRPEGLQETYSTTEMKGLSVFYSIVVEPRGSPKDL